MGASTDSARQVIGILGCPARGGSGMVGHFGDAAELIVSIIHRMGKLVGHLLPVPIDIIVVSNKASIRMRDFDNKSSFVVEIRRGIIASIGHLRETVIGVIGIVSNVALGVGEARLESSRIINVALGAAISQ